MFFRKKENVSGGYEYLIVGLGNPGKKYEFTRHNIGFMFLDFFAGDRNLKINKIKFKAVCCETVIDGKKCVLMKPQTYMNNSGEAVREAADFYKIPTENIIVIFDDVSLETAKIRIRRKGSAGGHNGIKSIISHLGSEEFPRIKIGVGEKPHEEMDLADWVLSSFSKKELEQLKESAKKAEDIISLMVDGKTEDAMSKYNS